MRPEAVESVGVRSAGCARQCTRTTEIYREGSLCRARRSPSIDRASVNRQSTPLSVRKARLGRPQQSQCRHDAPGRHWGALGRPRTPWAVPERPRPFQNALAVPERPGRPRTREPPQAAPARRRADAAPQAAPGRPSTHWTSQHGPGASQNALGVPERARPSQNAEAAPERHPAIPVRRVSWNAPGRFMVGTRTERGPTCPAVGSVPERAPPYRYAPVATLKSGSSEERPAL